MIIRIKQGATIVEDVEGRKVPLMRQVGQGGLQVDAKGPYGDRDSGYVYTFRFQRRNWTVAAEDVETASA